VSLSLTTSYEKICFVLNHSLNRHRICHFLRAKAGNSRDLEHGHDRQEDDREKDDDDDSQEGRCHHGSLAVGLRVAEESHD